MKFFEDVNPLLAAVPAMSAVIHFLIRTYRWISLRFWERVNLKGEFSELRYIRALRNLTSVDEGLELTYPLRKRVAIDAVQVVLKSYLKKKYRQQSSSAALYVIAVISFVYLGMSSQLLKDSQDVWELQPFAVIIVIFTLILFFILFVCSILCGFLLWLTDSSTLPGIRSYYYRNHLLRSVEIREIPLFELNAIAARKKEFIFIDATIRAGYPTSVLEGFPRVIGLCDSLGTVMADVSTTSGLLKSERQQSAAFGYQSLVEKLLCESIENSVKDWEADLCFFVFSEQGITSIEVTQYLKEHGYEAYNLGKTENRLVLLKRKIEELSILRECGIVWR